jgi:purine-binding chemotaxis protein CheW
MTRKRLRYSELAAEPVAPPVAPQTDVHMEPPTEALALRESSSVPRPRRDSTPVELARTLTAERAAARVREESLGAPHEAEVVAQVAAPINEPYRSLRERARTRSGTAELLMFMIGGERFAVELILVDEVIDLPVIHHVPEMPPAMLGVVTVRGSLTPVYSPQHALGLPLALRDALLIFRRGANRVGILIDDVDDALSVDMSALRDKPAGEESDGVLLGVIRLANTLVGIIDVDALITSCQSANILEPA